MNKEAKKLIDDLESIVLELHRSAGNLDTLIQGMRQTLNESNENQFYEQHVVKTYLTYRNDANYMKNYSSIGAREASIWERLLIETQRNEEVS